MAQTISPEGALLCPLPPPLRPGRHSRLERAQFPLGVQDLALHTALFVESLLAWPWVWTFKAMGMCR